MPFIRYSRDKRGYESTFVMHAYRPGQGPSRARVLYLFRSPSSLTVGRQALDDEAMEALEHTHPDLSFDWTALTPEAARGRQSEHEWTGGRQRDGWARGGGSAKPGAGDRGPASKLAQVSGPPVPAIVEDESLLGRTVGATEAARLRSRYNDLLQRIARRARTPEDRHRLTERAIRLNPDDWSDPAAVPAAVTSVEAEWDAIANELPRRRRGRRGGRHRHRPDAPSGSVIIEAGSEEEDGGHHDDPANAGVLASDRAADDVAGGGDRDIGAGETDTSDAATNTPTGGDLPGDG